MQLKGYKTPMECTRAIYGANGVKGLYAGFTPFLMQSMAKSSVRFLAFEMITESIGRSGIDSTQAWCALLGELNRELSVCVRTAAPVCY